MARQSFEYSIKFMSDVTGLRGVITELDKISNRAAQLNLTPQMTAATKEATKLKQILESSWNNKINRFDMTKVNNGIKKTYGSLKQFRTEMQKAGSEGVIMYQRIAQQSMTSALQIRKHSTMITQFVDTLKGHVRWFASAAITQSIIGSFSKAYNFTKDLDKALTDIRIVTNKSKEEMADFAKYAQKAAVSLSSSTKAYTEASLIYYQQGLSDQEVKARTNTTIKVANVTDMDAQSASEALTAVWNGFQVSAAETEQYIDKLAKVAATTASDLQELSTGMGKVASIANTVGVNIDQLTAQLSTIISVTRQAPESIGNALKTIYARIGDLQVNGEDESGVSLGKVSSTMKELGISILNEKGELRDLGSVIEETMLKWNGWTKAQKNAAAIAMAGIRQYNNLYALFENQDKYNRALKEAQEATGALQQQQEIYEDSTVAKLQKLSASAEKLYGSLFNQENMKGLISGFTLIVDALGNFVRGLGNGSKGLIQLGTLAVTVFRKQISASIQNSISNLQGFISNIRILRDNSNEYARQGLIAQGIVQGSSSTSGNNFYNNYRAQVEEQIGSKLASNYRGFIGVRSLMSPQQQQGQIDKMRQLAELQRQQGDLLFYQSFEKEKNHGFQSDLDVDQINAQYKNMIRKRENQLNPYIPAKIKKIMPNRYGKFSLPQVAQSFGGSQEAAATASARLFGVYYRSNPNIGITAGSMRQGSEDTYTHMQKVLQAAGLSNANLSTHQDRLRAIQRIKERETEIENELRKSNPNKALSQAEQQKVRQELQVIRRSMQSREAATADAGSAVEQNQIQQQNLQQQIEKEQQEAKVRKKISLSIAAVSAATTAITGLVNIVEVLNTKSSTIADVTQAVSSSVSSFGMQLGMVLTSINPIAGIAVTIGTALGGGVLQLIASSLKKDEAAVAEHAQAFEKTSNKIAQISDNWSFIQQYKTEYEVLAQGVDTLGQNLRLTNSQYDRFIELSNILGSKFPELINGYDEQGQAIIATNTAFKDLKQSIEEQNQKITTREEFTDYVKEKDKEKKELEDNLGGGRFFQNQVLLDLQSAGIDPDFKFKKTGKTVGQYQEEIKNGDLLNVQEILSLFEEEYAGNQEERVKDVSKALLDRFLEEEDTIKQNTAVLQDRTKAIDEDMIEKSITFAQLVDPDLITNSDKQEAYKTMLRLAPEINADTATQVAEFIKTLSPEQLKMITSTSDENLTYNDYISQYQGFGPSLTKTQKEAMPVWAKITSFSLDSDGNTKQNPEEFDTSLFTEDQQKTFEQIFKDMSTKFFGVKSGVILPIPQETQDRLRQFLQKTVTVQDLNNYTDLSNFLGIDWTKVSFNTGKEIIEQRAKTTQSLEAPQIDYKGVNSVLQNIMDADEKVKSGKELSNEDLKNIYDYNGNNEKILDIIQKMKSVRDTSSQEFKDLLEDYLQQMEDLSKESAVNTINIAYETLDTNLKVLNKDLDEYGLNFAEVQSKYLELGEEEFSKWLKTETNTEAVVKITADLSNYNATMDTIKEAEYEKAVTIKADVQSDFNQGFEVIDKMVSLSEILSKGLTINISDIQKLVEQGYGAILENATAAANGQIVLNKEVVNTVVKAKQEEFAAELKIQQERNELKVKQLDAEIEIAELELDMLEKSLASENTIEKAAYLAKAKMLENERENIENNYSTEWQNAKELTESQQQLATNLSNFMLTQKQSLTGDFLSLNASIDASNKAVAENQIGYYKQIGIAAQALIDQEWKELEGVEVTGLSKMKTFNDLKDSDQAFQQWKKELEKKNKDLANSITSAEFNLIGGILENSGQDTEVMDAYSRSEIQAHSELISALKQERAMYSSLNTAGVAGYSAITTGLENVQDAVGKTNDLLDDEIDRFHYLEKVIEKVSKVMSKLTDAQEKLIGAGLQENLQQQIALLQEENKLQERKREIAQNRANELRDTVAGYGAIFDNNGYIANYTELMTGILNGKNSLTTQYNAMSKADQEVNKELYDQEQKKLDHAEKIISQYEESIDKKEEAEEQQYQNNNDIIEKQIASMKVMSDLYLDIAEIQDSFREYRSTVIDRVGEKDYQKKIENAIEDLASGERKVQIHQQRLAELLEQERQMEATGTSSIYGENEAQLREDIKEETSSLMDLQKSNVENINNAFTALTQGLEDTFAVVNDFYSNQQAELDFRLKLINLLGGNSALQERVYNQQAEYYKGQLEAAQQETKLWNDQLDKAKQSNATEDQIRELTDKANEARKKENDLVISSIESLKNNYQSSIKSKLDEGFKDINNLQDQYDWTKTLNEPWLDDTARMYEIQKFQLSVQSEIDNTASKSAQRQLNEVMEKQLDILRTKDKLTKNDVDRANKIFDITKKQIALEEARQNKTRMRLRRDLQGNYSFQYVANESEIREKEKDLLTSTQDFYDSQKEYSKKSLEDAFAFVKQYREEVEKVYLDETLSEEERNQKVTTMRQQAEKYILELATESKYAQEMLLQDLYEYSLPTLYTVNSQNFIDSLNVEGSALKDWGTLFVNEWMSACNVGKQTLQSLTDASVAFYQNFSDLDKTIMVETIVPEFTEAVQTLMDKFTEPDGFNDVTNFAFTECERLSREYAQALNDLGNTAGYNFTQIHNGAWTDINDKEQAIQKIRTTNTELQTQIEKYTSLSSKIDDVNTSFTNFANNSDILVKGSVDTLAGWTDTFSNLSRMHRAFIQDFIDGKNVFSGKWPGIEWSSAMADALNASAQKVAESKQKINNAPMEGKYIGTPKKIYYNAYLLEDNSLVGDPYWKKVLDARLGHPVSVEYLEDEKGWTIWDSAVNSYLKDSSGSEVIRSAYYGKEDSKVYRSGEEIVKKLIKPGTWREFSYDTGGYTGAWHSQEGKLAILHEKELVLNKDDTKNLLSTVKLTRSFASTIQNIETNLANHLNQLQNKMISLFGNINIQAVKQSEQQGVQQHFTVNASFPNVENVKDIKEAFEYLSTYGQQYINRRY